jgi:hypothetical protein
MPTDTLTIEERRLFRSLDRPWKVQEHLNALPINFEPEGDTCLSPRRVIRERRAHCIEGAMFAAAVLRCHGHRPLILDLEASSADDDHVVAVFRARGKWGAISKTNHAMLRYREPVYRSVRELVMSYFHEYIVEDGTKTLRAYSRPVDLSRFDRRGWMTAEEDVWYVPEHLCAIPHVPILDRGEIARLRAADGVERRVVREIVEWEER